MACRLEAKDKGDGMDELSKLGIKYGTDKIGKHHYLPVYYEMFKDKRESVKKILEIGVGEGAGLRMWRDFFPNAMICGMDNQSNRVFEDNRIKVYKGDQSIEEDLIDFMSEVDFDDIDLVIDDGSHNPKDQVFTCLTLMPLLEKDTVYVIEDAAYANIVDSFSDYSYQVIKFSRRYDDRLVVVRHKNV